MTRLLRQGFWLSAFVFLLLAQFKTPTRQVSSPPVAELGCSGAAAPLGAINGLDVEDSTELLPTATPFLKLPPGAGLPLQQSAARLQACAAGVSYAHLSRPPPALLYC